MDGGKRVSRTSRTSWTTRCMGAGLRNSLGFEWSPQAWQSLTQTPATVPFGKHFQAMKTKSTLSKKSAMKPDVQKRRRKRKAVRQVQSTSKKAKLAYGQSCIISEPDIGADDLKLACQKFLDKEVNISCKTITEIEKCTQRQQHSALWQPEWRKRVTALHCG